MEHEQPQGIAGLYEAYESYEDLPKLSMSRDIYLNSIIFREELGLKPKWDPEIDRARKTYGHDFVNAVNATIDRYSKKNGGITDGEIEDVVVRGLAHEAQIRWISYTSPILDTPQEESLKEVIDHNPEVYKTKEDYRTRWREHLEAYGVKSLGRNRGVITKFIQDRITIDTGNEEVFLNNLRNFDQTQAA